METKLFSHDIQPATKFNNKPSTTSSNINSELSKKNSTPKSQEFSLVNAKEQLNAAIIQSAVNVNAGSNALSLVFKTALESINDTLKEALGENAIQSAYDSGTDISPEATADRIVSLSTAFFSSYQEQHPELSQKEAITKFTNIISDGINTGFSEARNILSGLNVLDGDIATNIDLSYALVQEKLTAFVDSFNAPQQ